MSDLLSFPSPEEEAWFSIPNCICDILIRGLITHFPTMKTHRASQRPLLAAGGWYKASPGTCVHHLMFMNVYVLSRSIPLRFHVAVSCILPKLLPLFLVTSLMETGTMDWESALHLSLQVSVTFPQLPGCPKHQSNIQSLFFLLLVQELSSQNLSIYLNGLWGKC